MQLPEDFLRETRQTMGKERFERYLKAFEEEPPVSIRVNPRVSLEWIVDSVEFATALQGIPAKNTGAVANSKLYTLNSKLSTKNYKLSTINYKLSTINYKLSPVPWCPTGYYLPTRPQFTFDPLLHAGCYYVQEASSMFLDEVLRQHLPEGPVAFLDLCAAPGGKSTLIRSALTADSLLVSNEPVRKRAQILSENIQKWGYANCFVTNNYPKDFRRAGLQFDAILCDVPCSGEGMFRKDPDTIGEWSLQNVERCWQLQREIVAEAWACLRPGGLFIYSTCTFNIKENEENISWILETYDAELLHVETQSDWGITPSLLKDFNQPVYRFIPGITRGEGLFMAVMRKRGSYPTAMGKGSVFSSLTKKLERMNLIAPLSPQPATSSPQTDLDYPTAISYLRGEAIVLPPDVPRGMVTVTFMGQPLGQAKNIGSRANNLYPKEWRIKSTHIPKTYETIFRPAEQDTD